MIFNQIKFLGENLFKEKVFPDLLRKSEPDTLSKTFLNEKEK